MVGQAFPYLNLAGILSGLIQIGGWVWFEHRLKHDLKVLAMPCVQYKIWKAAGMTKRGRFPVLQAASYSLRENFRIREAFGTGSAFISLAETIQSIRGFGEPKNEVFRLDS